MLDAVGLDGAADAVQKGSTWVSDTSESIREQIKHGTGDWIDGMFESFETVVKDPVGTASGFGHLLWDAGKVVTGDTSGVSDIINAVTRPYFETGDRYGWGAGATRAGLDMFNPLKVLGWTRVTKASSLSTHLAWFEERTEMERSLGG